MIYFLVTSAHRYTMELYRQYWGQRLANHIEIVPYETLRMRTTYPAGAYIFADLERLTPAQTERAGRLAQNLRRAGFPVLNDPWLTMRRYDLARTLFDRGDISFEIYRVAQCRRPHRVPVFLRPESEHKVISRLLRTDEEIDAAIGSAVATGYDIEDLLMVEFCDTSNADGIFRCYSAFVVGDEVIPRNLFAGRNWKLKAPDLVDEAARREEREYLLGNPHEDWIRRVFSEAGADYGKIDYAISGGKGQVWEINTNPIILWPRTEYEEAELATQADFGVAFGRALEAIDFSPSPGHGFCVTGPIAV